MIQTLLYFEDQRRDALMQTVDNISYSEPTISSDDPLVFSVPNNDLFIPRISPKHPFYQNQHDSFDLEQFQYPRPPIDLGHSRLTPEYLDMELTNVLRMLIKYPNSEYKIPSAIKPFWDLIQRVAEYESSFNTKHNECVVHITVDKRKISKHTSHRYPGFHGDGIQGSKFSQVAYTPIEHSYVVVSGPAMECCLQPFFFNHLNDSKHNIFHEMEVQARESNIFKVLPWHIYLIDPYIVHRTPFITEDVTRLFVRITFAYAELMNPHNTKNPLIDVKEYAPRYDIRKFLTLYPAEVPWEMYGFSHGPKSATRD